MIKMTKAKLPKLIDFLKIDQVTRLHLFWAACMLNNDAELQAIDFLFGQVDNSVARSAFFEAKRHLRSERHEAAIVCAKNGGIERADQIAT